MTGWVNSTVRISADVAWTSNASRIVALDLARPGAQPVVLEDTAALAWEEIAAHDGVTGEALVHALAEGFDLADDAIRADVEQMLTQLADLSLLAGR